MMDGGRDCKYVVAVLAAAAAAGALVLALARARREAFGERTDPREGVPMDGLWRVLTATPSPGAAADVDARRRVVRFHGGANPLVLEHRVTRVVMDVTRTRRVGRGRYAVTFRDPYAMLARGATSMPGVALHPALPPTCQIPPTDTMWATGPSAAGLASYVGTLTRAEASGLTSVATFADLGHHNAANGSRGRDRTSEVAKFADVTGLTALARGSPARPFGMLCVLRRPGGGTPTFVGVRVAGDALVVWCYRLRGHERSSSERVQAHGRTQGERWLARYRDARVRLGNVAVLRGAPVTGGSYKVSVELTGGRVRAFVESETSAARAAYCFAMPHMLPRLEDFATSPTRPMQLAYWDGHGLQRLFTAPMGDLTGGADGPEPPVGA